MSFRPILTGLICLCALGTGLAQAQNKDASELSPEEITALLEKQATRGITIAPASGGDAAAPAASADGTAVVAADYTEIPETDQINIRISFDFDSAALKESEKPKLVSLCAALKTSSLPLFRIVGHTDASGSAGYNQNLSQLRAEEVKRHMVGECGIPEEKLQAVGVGEAFPADAADPRADANRRVEIQVAS